MFGVQEHSGVGKTSMMRGTKPESTVLRIIFVTSEVAPFSKTGGLGHCFHESGVTL